MSAWLSIAQEAVPAEGTALPKISASTSIAFSQVKRRTGRQRNWLTFYLPSMRGLTQFQFEVQMKVGSCLILSK